MKDSNFDLDAERLALGIVPTETTRGRKKIPPRVSSVQAGLPDDWTRATFIVRIAYLDKLKDFAYTERISIKEALDVALERFLQDTNNLLPHNRERRDNTEIIRLDDEKTYGIKRSFKSRSSKHLQLHSLRQTKSKKNRQYFYCYRIQS